MQAPMDPFSMQQQPAPAQPAPAAAPTGGLLDPFAAAPTAPVGAAAAAPTAGGGGAAARRQRRSSTANRFTKGSLNVGAFAAAAPPAPRPAAPAPAPAPPAPSFDGGGGGGSDGWGDQSSSFQDQDDAAFDPFKTQHGQPDQPAERRPSGGASRRMSYEASDSDGEDASSMYRDERSYDSGEDNEGEEYDARFEGQKLDVLMEKKPGEDGAENAVVKMVMEGGAAQRLSVTVGSTLLAINGEATADMLYSHVLDKIRTSGRPLVLSFSRGPKQRDTAGSQGHVLARISGGAFSVGNLTRGNATWNARYYAFGGSDGDVFQLFASKQVRQWQ